MMSSTPSEFIETLVETIEKTRKKKGLRQTDVCRKADISRSAYQSLLYEKKISLLRLVKIMYALGMETNLKGLVHYEKIRTLDDIRDAAKEKEMPQRIRRPHG